MKFFWKIYFSFTVLFLLAFGLFGTWMIQMTFQQSYQKALKDGEWDNRMYQLAFETSLSSMNPEPLSDNMVQVIAVTVTQNLSDSGNVYRIYNSSKDLLYERNSCKIDGTEPFKCTKSGAALQLSGKTGRRYHMASLCLQVYCGRKDLPVGKSDKYFRYLSGAGKLL